MNNILSVASFRSKNFLFMKQNLFRTLVLSAFVLRWTMLLLTGKPAAEQSFLHPWVSDHLVVQRNCAMRFARDSNPDCNLYHGESLSAVQFRTDDLPGITEDHR